MALTVAVDFDGVIHKYSKGWQDGTIYDPPFDGAIEFLDVLIWKRDYSVFIHSTRDPQQIVDWFRAQFGGDGRERPFSVQIVPDDVVFWNKRGVLGVTNRKLPAIAYVDDRAVRFNGDWKQVAGEIDALQRG